WRPAGGKRIEYRAHGRGGEVTGDAIDMNGGVTGLLYWLPTPITGGFTWFGGMALSMPGRCCPGASCARRRANCSGLRAWVDIIPAPSPAAELKFFASSCLASIRTRPRRTLLTPCRRKMGSVFNV